MKIIKEELRFEENLKKRLEFICEFSKATPTFINGSIRKLEKTNLTYIEPHKVIIKSITFLVFNVSDDLYKNGIFDDNDNEIANNIYRKVTMPDENKVEKNRRKNDIKF